MLFCIWLLKWKLNVKFQVHTAKATNKNPSLEHGYKICHHLFTKINISDETVRSFIQASTLHIKWPTFGLIAGSAHAHTSTNCMALLAPKHQSPACCELDQTPHITMEMALHCGARIGALEGSWHVYRSCSSSVSAQRKWGAHSSFPGGKVRNTQIITGHLYRKKLRCFPTVSLHFCCSYRALKPLCFGNFSDMMHIQSQGSHSLNWHDFSTITCHSVIKKLVQMDLTF